MTNDDDWFLPKRFGYGAGLPIAWQGWALILGFVLALGAGGLVLLPRHPAFFAVLAVLLVIPLTILSAQHTRGGWRWRWGEAD